MPPSVPFNHYLEYQRTNKMAPRPFSIIPCTKVQAFACFEHSNFFKVNTLVSPGTQRRAPRGYQSKVRTR